jgi:hypothetical protein
MAVQLGRSDLLQPTRHNRDLIFDFTLRMTARGGRAVFLGPTAQGPPADRFIYVNSGTMAGQAGSCWTRRAKLKLGGITAASAKRAVAGGGRLETRMAGTGRDGGPSCATVPLIGGWRIT